jgi:TolB protein
MHRVLRWMFVGVGLLLLAPSVAEAAFPGRNGKIAYTACLKVPPNAVDWYFNCEIFVMNPDGSGKQRLTHNDPGVDYNPAWSADGRKIAFNSERGNRLQIYSMNADGTDQRPLTNETESPLGPSWSPDGQSIAFTSTRHAPGTYNYEIHLMNADGTGVRQLTQVPVAPGEDIARGSSEWPRWSPDGQRIAFMAPSPPNFLGYDIHTIRPDGTGETALIKPGYQSSPDWSPDGSKFVFYGEDDDFAELRVMSVDGSSEIRLDWPGGFFQHPAWSPNQRKIVADTNVDIYVQNADGSGVTNLTNNDREVYESHPNWQPLIAPRRSDYKNAAQFCRAEREFLGDAEFAQTYAADKNGSNAFGKCVRRNT